MQANVQVVCTVLPLRRNTSDQSTKGNRIIDTNAAIPIRVAASIGDPIPAVMQPGSFPNSSSDRIFVSQHGGHVMFQAPSKPASSIS